MSLRKTVSTGVLFFALGMFVLPSFSLAQAPAPAAGTPPSSNSVANPMKAPLPPFRVIGNIYYVGSAGIACYIIKTTHGAILLDTGYPDMAAQIEDNIRQIGVQLSEVKVLINSHAHQDHGGGMAQLKMDTGAKLVAMAEDAPYFESGGHNDALFGDRNLFPPVHVDRVIHDGDTVALGDVVLTAHLTPGHTPGNTTWTMPVTDGEKSYDAVFFGMIMPMPNTNLAGTPSYPNIGADWARTMKVLPTIHCDVFLSSNGVYFDMAKKREALLSGASPNPFIDPKGCADFTHRAEATYQNLLNSAPPASSNATPASGTGPAASASK
jgi:metallo-beta-lactamase class B